ncbi:YceI family protein [Arcticibacterium luteifluviistationis]|uniref:YceI family protein n=1 Tax=Arcticibacterium luteifluviistationis TaxID=1784714 RepID=A0A2Z4GDR0_9BACT|nr:YceI family protein [Arcticibacterium luteifluviistationis]AWV99043.1 YceI family protein [Arcticibacterium luteifluviistationis]
MKNLILALGVILCLGGFVSNIPAKKKVIADTGSSTFMYALRHPLHSFEGVSKSFNGIGVYNEESEKLEIIAVKVAVNSFDSGNSNRDSHVIETIDALKYPSVTFTAEDISYVGDKVTAKGKLVFHGQTKPFTVVGVQELNKGVLSISGDFNVNMIEFGVEPPSLMGMSTDEEIMVSFDFKFKL